MAQTGGRPVSRLTAEYPAKMAQHFARLVVPLADEIQKYTDEGEALLSVAQATWLGEEGLSKASCPPLAESGWLMREGGVALPIGLPCHQYQGMMYLSPFGWGWRPLQTNMGFRGNLKLCCAPTKLGAPPLQRIRKPPAPLLKPKAPGQSRRLTRRECVAIG